MIQETRQMLTDCRGKYPQIAEETGLGLQWLYKFGQGHIDSPSAQRLLRLNAYLKKHHRKLHKAAV